MGQDGGDRREIRSDWTLDEVRALHALPFSDLIHRAQSIHRRHFDPNAVQVSTLLSIKTGACPEDCAYCPQSIRYDTGPRARGADEIRTTSSRRARAARERGSTRFCMGAAWRSRKDRDLETVARDDPGVTRTRTRDLRDARHAHADAGAAGSRRGARLLQPQSRHVARSTTARSSRRAPTRTGSTRSPHVRDAGIHVCCGGILGMGESADDRIALLHTLATLDPHPESVPVNKLVQVEGTPLAGTAPLDPIEFVRIDRARAHPDAALACAPLRRPRRR